MSVHSSVSHSLNEAPIPYNVPAAKLQTQHCCTSTRSTYAYRDWFSFGWPLRRCQVTLVHRDIQVAARSVGCIRCVRALDVGMWNVECGCRLTKVRKSNLVKKMIHDQRNKPDTSYTC